MTCTLYARPDVMCCHAVVCVVAVVKKHELSLKRAKCLKAKLCDAISIGSEYRHQYRNSLSFAS